MITSKILAALVVVGNEIALTFNLSNNILCIISLEDSKPGAQMFTVDQLTNKGWRLLAYNIMTIADYYKKHGSKLCYMLTSDQIKNVMCNKDMFLNALLAVQKKLYEIKCKSN